MPYRKPAEMPEEKVEKEMNQNEYNLKICKLIVAGVMASIGCLAICNVINTSHTNQMELTKIQLQSTPEAAIAAHERFLEAQAARDRAMFEGIVKQTQK